MTEHDFSQLPVVDENKKPLGIVTSDSILHALSNFGVSLAELRVSHTIMKVDTYSPDEDLFDLLDDLKNTYAVLIVNAEGTLIGIVTSYDTTDYFIPIRVLSDKFEWQVTHEHAAKCYQLERILVSDGVRKT